MKHKFIGFLFFLLTSFSSQSAFANESDQSYLSAVKESFNEIYENTLEPLPLQIRLGVIYSPFIILCLFAPNDFTRFAAFTTVTINAGLSAWLFKHPPEIKDTDTPEMIQRKDPENIATMTSLMFTPWIFIVFQLIKFCEERDPLGIQRSAQPVVNVARTLIISAARNLYEASPHCMMCFEPFTDENPAVRFVCGHSYVHMDLCLEQFLRAFSRCLECKHVVAQ